MIHCKHSSPASIEGKIYKLKESKLWTLDFGYYSDRSRKYITYQNPIDFGDKSVQLELFALKNALFLGELLNRTVILPKFSCGACKDNKFSFSRKCGLDAHISVSTFDRFFAGRYRESAFLSHPFVPKRVKKSSSKPILIRTDFVRLGTSNRNKTLRKGQKELLIFSPSNPIIGTRQVDVLRWFNAPPYRKLSILKFHHLYNVFKWPLPSWSTEHVMFEVNLKASLLSKNVFNVKSNELSVWDIVSQVFAFLPFFNSVN